MPKKGLQHDLGALLARADVTINGHKPWDLQVHNQQFYARVLTQGTLGLGESYMEGWWDCDSIDEFVFRALRADLYKQARLGWQSWAEMLLSRIFNRQTQKQAAHNARQHYDIGNQLYQLMLDKRLAYSCGYWKNADDLDTAQENKLDLICRKLNLQPGQQVLDIGCGWGSFARFAAEQYGVTVVGITVAREQVELGREMCKGLPVEIRLQDYRDVNETFDHVVSVGMAEHVGLHNFRTYMQTAARCLKSNGLFLLHTIGLGFSKTAPDPFINKYIFPNCLIPSLKQLSTAMENIFVVEDVHNFGPYYDLTLMAWFRNFNQNWPLLQNQYGDRFYRMWKYYLLSSAGSFRARNNQLWQLVLSKNGVLGGYEAVR
ncbi:cyclopropane fatty acyl phospholipid synthase [Adhaeribacter rhizoryzae]|uniref:Cyclopropane fatty acyl phospholipid synthase n=1 Tax=Adhaeribacter rhizoryzae TaxID=2607907 RepID=A0A5M6D2D3_9BACT|nr:cyclopropane fatty acyl phospholipid synthase [Adhaeribacter rhizoryzae]KAA5541611.1 cyclopropane fatty acyl phospholipid synthase [Adhaeribacter rhizoryzae]